MLGKQRAGPDDLVRGRGYPTRFLALLSRASITTQASKVLLHLGWAAVLTHMSTGLVYGLFG